MSGSPARASPAGARAYPPSPVCAAAVAQIAALPSHEWTAEEALMPLSPASALAARCCVVTELPHQPRGRAEGNKLTFGQEVDGYVLVKPRA